MTTSNSSTNNIMNPIHVNQLIGFNVENVCETVECANLNTYLSNLYKLACEAKNQTYELGCLQTDNTTVDVINTIITELCTLKKSVGQTGTSTTETPYDINGSLPGNWQFTDNVTIQSTGTNEEIIQFLFSRVIDLSNHIKDLQTAIALIDTKYNNLLVEIQNKPCC